MTTSRIRYAQSGHARIASQVVGDGTDNLVLALGYVSHLEHMWEDPLAAAFLHRQRIEFVCQFLNCPIALGRGQLAQVNRFHICVNLFCGQAGILRDVEPDDRENPNRNDRERRNEYWPPALT